MKNFEFKCLKCGSENVMILMENRTDFSKVGGITTDLFAYCVDCPATEEIK